MRQPTSVSSSQRVFGARMSIGTAFALWISVPSRSVHTLPAWIGLLLGKDEQQADSQAFREILGPDARIVLIDPMDSPFNAVRRLVHTGASSVVAIERSPDSLGLTTLLRVLCSLGGFRRIVVVHDAPETTPLLGIPGLVLLRDCPEVRASLRTIVRRDAAPELNFTPSLATHSLTAS